MIVPKIIIQDCLQGKRMDTHKIGLVAFLATGLAFKATSAKHVRQPLSMNKPRKERKETKQIDEDFVQMLIDNDIDEAVAPITLRSA